MLAELADIPAKRHACISHRKSFRKGGQACARDAFHDPVFTVTANLLDKVCAQCLR